MYIQQKFNKKVKLSWTADKKLTVEVGGATVFTEEDFSGISDLGNKIAIKGGSYASASAVTNVYLKNIHYTGQAEAETYAAMRISRMKHSLYISLRSVQKQPMRNLESIV